MAYFVARVYVLLLPLKKYLKCYKSEVPHGDT